MSRPRTRICAYSSCDKPIVEQTPTRRLYCSDAHKQSAWRERHQPVVVELEPVVHRQSRPGRKREVGGSGWIRLPGNYGSGQRDLDHVLWKLTLSPERYAQEVWRESYWEAAQEYIEILFPPVDERHFPTSWAETIWRCRWLNRPITGRRMWLSDLTAEQRLKIVTVIPQVCLRGVEAFIEAEKVRMMSIEIQLQNELILARQKESLARQQETLDRLERLQELAAETFAKVAATAERVRDRFPNNAEVSAAVDRLLEDVGATVAKDEDLS